MPASADLQRPSGSGALAAPLPIARRRLRLDRDTLLALLALSPSLLAVAIFIYSFIFWTVGLSFLGWNDVVPDFRFVGLRNYERLLETERFLKDLRNLAVFGSLFLGQCIAVGLLLAILLDQRIKGEAVFRTIFIFPFAISTIVTGVIWRWLMYPESGLNLLFELVGLGFLKSNWYADVNIGIAAVSLPMTWQMSGYTMALYLAGLRSIPHELREAAKIDGASGWQYYRYVAIPLLMPITFTVLVILGTITIRLFDITASMTSSGPDFADDTLAFFMFQTTFQQYRYSQGAAIAVVMMLLSLLLIVPYLRRSTREGQ